MKSSSAIEVLNLSKKYRLGTIGMTSLREDLGRWWNKKSFNKIFAQKSQNDKYEKIKTSNNNDFWALKEINFSIPKGEVVGLIGANGSGKSTLLKILSRITEPTAGEIKIRGKVASLLEVGTGFHPELSGRENIFINGAILGMTRKEVALKFDEIVDFAGVTKFIDTPIKRYSSGMTVRLGFAVAAHLNPDLLIVDEVLAVGDAEFQKKCIGKMESISNSGRTIIFVSHNMSSVESLCKNSILLHNGRIEMIGGTSDVIYQHLSKSKYKSSTQELNLTGRRGTGEYALKDIKFLDPKMKHVSFGRTGSPLGIKVVYERKRLTSGKINFCLSIDRLNPKIRITSLCSNFVDCKINNSRDLIIEILIPKLNLKEQTYAITTDFVIDGVISECLPNVLELRVKSGDYYGNGSVFNEGLGQVLIDFEMNSINIEKTNL